MGQNQSKSLASPMNCTVSKFWDGLRRMLARILLPDEVPGESDVVALVPNPKGDGLWTLDRRGNIVAVGKAPDFREVPEPVPWRDGTFVALASTPSGLGLWALDRKGNIFAFGDAPDFREVPEPEPWRGRSFVAMASTPTGQGLWVLDRDGHILSFGDAAEFPSANQRR